jgi:hypothetical protein
MTPTNQPIIQKAIIQKPIRSQSTGNVHPKKETKVKQPQVPSPLSRVGHAEHKTQEHKEELPEGTSPHVEIRRKVNATGPRSQTPTPKRNEPSANPETSAQRAKIQRINSTPKSVLSKQVKLNYSSGEEKKASRPAGSKLITKVTGTFTRKKGIGDKQNLSAPGSRRPSRSVSLDMTQKVLTKKFTRTGKDTPRQLTQEYQVNALPPSEEVRDKQEKEFLDALKDAESSMAKRVREIGVEVGLRFSEQLANQFENALKPIYDSKSKKMIQWNFEHEINIQGPFAIGVAQQLTKEKDNPFARIGSLVGAAIAHELAEELAKWKIDVDLSAASRLDEKIRGGVKPPFVEREGKLELEHKEPAAETWIESLRLTEASQGNGLYKLAQGFGETIGNSWKVTESEALKKRFVDLEALKKRFIEDHGDDKIIKDFDGQLNKFIKDYDNQMTMIIAGAYVRIAKQVAMELVEPLLLAMRKELVKVVVRKKKIQKETNVQMDWDKKTLIQAREQSPGPKPSVPARVNDPQSPTDAAVQLEDSDVIRATAVQKESYKGVKITSPENPDNINT